MSESSTRAPERSPLVRRLTAAFDAVATAVGFGSDPDPLLARGFEPARRLVQEERPALTAFAGAAVVDTAVALALPLAVAAAIDSAARGRVGHELLVLAVLAAVAVAASAVVAAAGSRFTRRGGASLGARVGTRGLLLGVPGRRPFDHSDVVRRTLSDAANVGGLPIAFAQLVRLLAVAVGALVALVLVDWVIALTAVAVVALVVGAASRLQKDFRGTLVTLYERIDHLCQQLTDALGGRRTIAACATLDRESARVRAAGADVIPAAARVEHLKIDALVLVDAVQVGLRVTLLPVAGWLLVRGRITAGQLVAVLGYTELIAASVMGLVNNGVASVATARVSGARTLHVLDAPVAAVPPDEPAAAPAPPLAVSMRDVTVSDGAGAPILDNVTLEIEPGTSIAVVGRSGAGKSTIAQLIGRLTDPTQGSVHLDGVDVRDLAECDLRALVSYAFERPALLGTNIADTVSYGGRYERAAVEQACDVAAASDFVTRLPQQWDTPLDDAPMSGGEQQRLGLARVALRRTPIVVFDDALSSLDVATEARVAASFAGISRGRTTVTVAHRASTAARADVVAWLDGCRIRAVAPHAELWRDPDYRGAFEGAEGAPA